MNKTTFGMKFVGTLFSIGLLLATTVLGQGSLIPPGGPMPMMKTLGQIEPRIAIFSAPFVITQAGSYYLTTNLAVVTGDAIDIETNGVTLDLNGFTLSSTASNPNGCGILLVGSVSDVAILNGHIVSGVTNNESGVYNGTGFGYGVYGSSAINTRIKDVTVYGCLYNGIWISGPASLADSCTAWSIGGVGVFASGVSHCTAYQCGSAAISGITVSDCYGLGSGPGVAGSVIHNCVGSSTGADGVHGNEVDNCFGYTSASGYSGISANAAQNCNGNNGGSESGGSGVIASYSALNCVGSSTAGNGISATTAQNCYGTTSVGYSGINATTVYNCYGSSTGTQNGVGITATLAQGCYGTSSGYGNGLSATIANSCYGYCPGGQGYGVAATIANSCYGRCIGTSATGLSATTALNCSGNSTGSTSYGIIVSQVAIGCYGYGTVLGLKANVADSCFGTNSSGISETIAYKYNMP